MMRQITAGLGDAQRADQRRMYGDESQVPMLQLARSLAESVYGVTFPFCSPCLVCFVLSRLCH